MAVKKLKALVIGAGSIGQRHIHNLQKIGINKIGVFDLNTKKLSTLINQQSIQLYNKLEESFSFDPHFAIICTWPDSHTYLAKKCIQNNCHIFIEKPISSSTIGVEKILKTAASKKLTISVGYNTRFEKGLNIVKKELRQGKIGIPMLVNSQWGNNLQNWAHPMRNKNHHVLQSEGGVILENGSHEIDYIQWLLDDKVTSVYCQTSRVSKAKTPSSASLILKFAKGTIATLMFDYIRPRYERSCHIIGNEGDIRWSFFRGTPLDNYKTKASSYVKLETLKKKSFQKKFSFLMNDMYIQEMRDFITSLENNTKPKVDGWSGFETLKIGLAATKSAEKNKPVSL